MTVNLISGIADSREACVALAGKYRRPQSADRVLEGAAMYQQVTLKRLGATEADELLYERLAASIIYASASLRADPKVIAENQRGQSGLWGFGISGNSPIVLLQIADAARMESVRQLVHAHDYWRAYGLVADLVILCGGGGEPSFFVLVGTLDGNELASPEFSLVDDGRRHAVVLHVKRAPRPPRTGDAKCNSA